MSGVAVVVGSGRSVHDDLRAIRRIVAGPVYFAVNDMIALLPVVDHGVSHHPEKVPLWAGLRRTKVVTHASAVGRGIDHVWPQFREGRSGSSSLLATRIALELGFDRVIVAGVPLDAKGYIWSDPLASEKPDAGMAFQNFTRYRLGWQDHQAKLRGRVTAVSGYLAELLGRPVLADAVHAS